MKVICGAAVVAALTLLVGCSSTSVSSSGDDGDCTSHYEPVADAPAKQALKKRLLQDIDPRTRSFLVINKNPHDGKVFVNLLTGHKRIIMSLELWVRDDGTWTAQRWSQCID
jgi:hypothetical protein